MALTLLTMACADDDDGELSDVCVGPADSTMVSNCLLDELEARRPADRPEVRYRIDLLRKPGETRFLYALVPDAFDLPIPVYNYCCELDCELNVFPGDGCPWRNDAEEFGIIFEE